ncbi:MAG: hypothetical protein JOZ22_24625 [Acidobacteriia bacterium]|nr:hypothetical protein [Terriglobia bacterium]
MADPEDRPNPVETAMNFISSNATSSLLRGGPEGGAAAVSGAFGGPGSAMGDDLLVW